MKKILSLTAALILGICIGLISGIFTATKVELITDAATRNTFCIYLHDTLAKGDEKKAQDFLQYNIDANVRYIKDISTNNDVVWEFLLPKHLEYILTQKNASLNITYDYVKDKPNFLSDESVAYVTSMKKSP